MYKAYAAAGGKAKFVLVPPFHNDGHKLFISLDGREIWQPLLEQFLSLVE
jgi:hypothetical protein